jgi:phospholipid/cholesterol/gamma-HCH transport system substrate-binding protein
MKTKFTKYERVAGVFVLTAFLGSIAITLGVAIKKGLLEQKLHLTTELKSADGVRQGTQVLMAGLRAGSVTGVKLVSNEKIVVDFEISEAYKDRVRKDSIVRLVRPFVIGEKVLDVSVGSDEELHLNEFAKLESEETPDIMDLMSGRSLGPYLQSMSQVMDSLKYVVQALLDPERSKNFVKMFDELVPLLHNMSGMSGEMTTVLKQVNNKKQLGRILQNMANISDEMNAAIPAFKKQSPQLATDVAKIAKNMAVLTDELQKTLPLLHELGPELPKASKRAFEALDETVVTLKALQKSFLLRGNVRDVRSEEALREIRLPASDKKGQNP